MSWAEKIKKMKNKPIKIKMKDTKKPIKINKVVKLKKPDFIEEIKKNTAEWILKLYSK